MNSKEKIICIIRNVIFILCLAFSIFSVLVFLIKSKFDSFALALVTVALIFVPDIICRIFRCRMNTVAYIAMLIYALCPLLGHSYKLYYIIPCFDKILHTVGGFAFAMLGSYIVLIIQKAGKPSLLLRALFALCFSMALSMVWEFFEYFGDMWFCQDMQADTVIYSINSHMLGGGLGDIGRIEKIESVIINGIPMEGYIDIGLIDTMNDMLVETAGAIIYFLWLMIDRDRHPIWKRT